jgi:hypothetical protein
VQRNRAAGMGVIGRYLLKIKGSQMGRSRPANAIAPPDCHLGLLSWGHYTKVS